MEIVVHNPHVNIHLGENIINYLFRAKSFKKYNYLLKYLKDNNKPFAFYVDKSSLPEYLSFIPLRLEIFVWLLINKYNPLSTKVVYRMSEVKNNAVFISFGLDSLENESFIRAVSSKRFIKIFHLTHFVQNTSLLAKNFELCGGDFLIAENNLHKNSSYFRKYFKNYKKDVYLLPFVYEKRFMSKKYFPRRKNKCVATGTIVKIKEFEINSPVFKDFYDYFNTDTLHPMRQEILNNKKALRKYVDSYIANFWEKKRKKWENIESPLKRWEMRLYNAFFASKRKYLSFDIVEKYNDYKMFIAPEEINNLPGIGFVEGMACGTAYIGIDDPMYRDLGLAPGKHYISYDGSLSGLQTKIGYYQKHTAALGKIAKEGEDFVRKSFSAEVVSEKFWNDLTILYNQYRKTDKKRLQFESSFQIK